MRSIIISGLLLLLTFSFVFFTETAASASLDKLIKITESLPDTPDENTAEKLDKLQSIWDKNSVLYSSVIKYDYLYSFTKELSSARSGASADDDGTYLSSKENMLISLRYLQNTRKLRLCNLI